jgi:hypothetical protein
MLLSPAFKKSFRGLPQSSQQVILRTMLDVTAKAVDRPVRLVGSQKCSRRAVGGHELLYLSAAGCRKILFVDIVTHSWAVLPGLEPDIRGVPGRQTPTRESAIAQWGYRARRGHHGWMVLRSTVIGTSKGSSDEPIGRPPPHKLHPSEELRPPPTERSD